MRSDKTAKVSVIVPICNVEKYLDQCLKSIEEQTHANLEIICLNDGSKDGSLEIIREHAALDERIVVVDKDNEGYGATCNRGIEMATGAWVSIIEPDDWLELGMFEEMLALASSFEEPIDIVKCPWIDIMYWNDAAKQHPQASMLTNRLTTSTKPFKLVDQPILIESHPSIWSAIYRKDFLNEKGIRFVPYPGAGWADNPFLIETMCQAEAILFLNKAFYNYRADIPGSTRNHKTDDAVTRPFDRWVDMTDVLERLGVTDGGVLAAHYLRGFNYVDGAIYDDGWTNPLVQEGARRVFSRMDPEIVATHPKLKRARRDLYSEVMGATLDEKPAPTARLAHLSGELAHELKTNGSKRTFERIKKYLGGSAND